MQCLGFGGAEGGGLPAVFREGERYWGDTLVAFLICSSSVPLEVPSSHAEATFQGWLCSYAALLYPLGGTSAAALPEPNWDSRSGVFYSQGSPTGRKM